MPPALTARQEQLIIGTMLGDGCFQQRSAYPSYQSNHGWIQHEYNLEKHRLLSVFVNTPPEKRKNGGYGKWSSQFSTLQAPAFRYLYHLCCPNGKKQVNKEWLKRLTWEGVAWWIADDGSLAGTKTSPSMVFHTEGFSKSEVQLLVTWLRRRGVGCKMDKVTNRHDTEQAYWTIRCTVDGTLKLLSETKRFAPRAMSYKWEYKRLDEAVCYFCQTRFKPTGNMVKNPDSELKHCCGKPECLKLRKNMLSSEYELRNRETINQKSSERYYADHEKNKEYHRRKAAEWIDRNRDDHNARRRTLRAAAAAVRPPRQIVCECCKTTFETKVAARIRYCSPECRKKVRKETVRRYDQKRRMAVA